MLNLPKRSIYFELLYSTYCTYLIKAEKLLSKGSLKSK